MDPKERGEGIATEMIRSTLGHIMNEGGEKAYIDTHSKNPAKRLYEKIGFRVVEKIPNLRYEL